MPSDDELAEDTSPTTMVLFVRVHLRLLNGEPYYHDCEHTLPSVVGGNVDQLLEATAANTGMNLDSERLFIRKNNGAEMNGVAQADQGGVGRDRTTPICIYVRDNTGAAEQALWLKALKAFAGHLFASVYFSMMGIYMDYVGTIWLRVLDWDWVWDGKGTTFFGISLLVPACTFWPPAWGLIAESFRKSWGRLDLRRV